MNTPTRLAADHDVSEQAALAARGAAVIRKAGIFLSRKLGASLCLLSDHKYFFPDGCFNGWSAYTCVRCGALSCPLDSLPPAPPDEDFTRWHDEEDDERIEQQHKMARRWFASLPWPRWV